MNRFHHILAHVLFLVFATASVMAQDLPEAEGVAEVLKGRPYSPYANRGYPENVYFGDTHVHSALSTDAGGGGTVLMPRDMYRFAREQEGIQIYCVRDNCSAAQHI